MYFAFARIINPVRVQDKVLRDMIGVMRLRYMPYMKVNSFCDNKIVNM
jgi:hypothetical protein